MHKILITAAVTLLVFLFCLQNANHAQVSFIFGSPKTIRLCFLVLMAAGLGYLSGYFLGLSSEIKLRRHLRRLSLSNQPPSDTLAVPPKQGGLE